MSNKQSSKSKRQMVKEQRLRRQRRQRLVTIAVISGIALILVAIIAVPSILRATAPVGEFTTITPREYPMKDGRALGAEDAPVLVEVYEDFQCPACRDFSQQIEPLVIDNEVATGRIRYVFRHFPFIDDRAPGNESDQSANASMCATEQGQFWEYHEMLFANWNGENHGAFSDRRLIAFAEALGLDMDQFNNCFRENRYQAEINDDLEKGRQAGVTGTPSVLVNGQIITPGFIPTYSEIRNAVDQAIAASGN